MTIQTTRRDTLRQIGFVAGAAGASIPVFGSVSAATSAATLTLEGTIPDATDVSATVEEYDTETSDSPILTETNTITDAGTAVEYGDLDAQADYYYLFDLQFNSDGSDTPDVDALVFEVPQNFENTDYTTTLDWRAKPDSVSIAFDEQYLHEHQPMLRMSARAREEHKGLYGYVATSSEQDTDALCYWNQFTHQDGLPSVRADTHLGDHEPIYVFVNSKTGEVEEVVYSDYHWFTGSESINSPSDQLATARTQDPTHPVLSVSAKWHNYQYAAGETGAFVELRSWPAVRDTWVQNGFYESADVSAIENPWEIRDLDSWWQRDSFDHRVAGVWARVGRTLGWFGAESDEESGWW